MRRNFFQVGVATLLALSACAAAAQESNNPVRLLVGYSAGGAIDAVGRAVADKLRETLRQPVVVENSPAQTSAWRCSKSSAPGPMA